MKKRDRYLRQTERMIAHGIAEASSKTSENVGQREDPTYRMATDYFINLQDADLMQILCQQDADLGYSWQYNEPVKQLKEPETLQKPELPDVHEFFIDSETGEQIPISRSQQAHQATEPAPVQQSQVALFNSTTDANGNTFNLDDCLEILENSMEDMRPQKPSSQRSVDERNNIVRNLTSLLDTSDQSPTVRSDPDNHLWQQIDELSDLTGLNLHEPVVSPSRSELNGTLSYNTQSPVQALQQENVNAPYNFTVTDYNNQGQTVRAMPMYDQCAPRPFQLFPDALSGTERSSPVVQTSPFNAPSMSSDDGIPMDTSFVQVESSQPQQMSGNSFEDFSYQMDSSSLPNDNAAVAALPEPGQGFFDYLQQDSNATDFSATSSNLNSFSPQSTSFMNPPVATYPPPPLDTTPSTGVYLEEFHDQQLASTLDKSAIVECYESDSGISIDHSPLGSSLKSESSSSDQDLSFNFNDLNSVQHNHTYDGTVESKKLTKKKAEKPALPRESRDERRARELNIPFTLSEIILSPVEEYNEMLARTPLNPAQQVLVKDIRRRGKNKVAAQNCRKRKIETISSMEDDVEVMRSKKQQLVDEQKELEMKYERMKHQYTALHQQIFSSLRDDGGRPYDPEHYRLEQVEGAVLLVPHRLEENRSISATAANIDYAKVKYERS